MDDPVADTVRGIVDGHIVLSRKIAQHGHYPAIDVLQSVSRTMNMTSTEEHQHSARLMRDLIATWRENEELIRLGAYRIGTDPKVDKAIQMKEHIDGFLQQGVEEPTPFKDAVTRLVTIAKTPAQRTRREKASRSSAR